MKNELYLPEGRRIGTIENNSATKDMEALKQSMASGRIIEGHVLRCDADLNLTVSLGEYIGLIPKSQAAMGIDTGKTRDIAIISRVGKPVCFKISEIQDDKLLLSRRDAQEEALECFLSSLSPGDVIDATVTHLESFGAFVDMGCGLPAMISIEKISTARIAHPSERFSAGMRIRAAVNQIDREQARFNLSHRELLGTWEENAAHFTQGETVRGIVRSIKPYGAFVELTPNLSGLTEPFEGLNEGSPVSVYIKSIIPDRRKIKLIIISRLAPEDIPAMPLRYYITDGNVAEWRY